jgi:hypothetical protein
MNRCRHRPVAASGGIATGPRLRPAPQSCLTGGPGVAQSERKAIEGGRASCSLQPGPASLSPRRLRLAGPRQSLAKSLGPSRLVAWQAGRPRVRGPGGPDGAAPGGDAGEHTRQRPPRLVGEHARPHPAANSTSVSKIAACCSAALQSYRCIVFQSQRRVTPCAVAILAGPVQSFAPASRGRRRPGTFDQYLTISE